MSIADLIGKACGVKSWQIAGPPWIRTSRFDVLAKIPAGVGKDRVPDMLRSLLAERFQLKLHSQPTEQAVYVLLAGKGGPRLLPAVSEIPAPGAPEPKEQSLTSNGSVSSYRNGKLRATKISTNEGGTILL
jgi:uncharacterized protein (TIGR03435 family)